MDSNRPIIVIEVVMTFGGVLLFAWWQSRSIRRDQQKATAQKLAQAGTERQAESRSEKNNPSE
jgi:predicted negative regulator of RcsB-dependent stress response